MTRTRSTYLYLFGLWLVLMLASLAGRSYVPIDETRYVTVAWEMWLRGDFLVPHLNGATYAHKPPLLFWLYDLGWWAFGVNDWWPRLVAPLFGLGSLWLTRRLATRLWPALPLLADVAPTLLLGCLFWSVYTTAAMFDMLVVFFTLVGILGIVEAWQGNPLRGRLLLALAIGLGVLAKGPVILLLTLPVALLAPWWMLERRPARWRGWYLGLLAAVLGGAAIALAWAIPAALRGGQAYADAIFWGQTANRVVNSFAHRRGIFWYLPLLPLLLFPWFIWPRLWGSLAALRKLSAETGMRLVLAWLLPLFLAFSLISGKQIHYLLPLFPAFALLAARALVNDGWPPRRDLWLPALGVAAMGAALATLPWWSTLAKLPAWHTEIQSWYGLLAVTAGILLLRFHGPGLLPRINLLTGTSALLVLIFLLGVFRAAAPAYDMRPLAKRLADLETAGIPVAHVGEYKGQYQFLGRLHRPLEVVERPDLAEWAQRHPDGVFVDHGNRWPITAPDALFVQPYIDGSVGIWPAQAVASANTTVK